jgi:hypothetical protein
MMMMMSISPFGHKAVGDISGVSEMYSHQSHSPLIEAMLISSSSGGRRGSSSRRNCIRLVVVMVVVVGAVVVAAAVVLVVVEFEVVLVVLVELGERGRRVSGLGFRV